MLSVLTNGPPPVRYRLHINVVIKDPETPAICLRDAIKPSLGACLQPSMAADTLKQIADVSSIVS